jgi:hypothetical protein
MYRGGDGTEILKQYFEDFSSAWDRKNGVRTAELLMLQPSDPREAELVRMATTVNLQSACAECLVPQLAPIACGHLSSRVHFVKGDYIAAYQQQLICLKEFIEAFRAESNWPIPVLHRLTFDTRVIASKADVLKSTTSGKQTKEHLRDAEQTLKKGFSMTVNDRAQTLSESKKLGCLYVVNNLFKIYFKLNTLRLCKNIIRAVESPVFPALTEFKKRDTVTYYYYTGRLSMFEDQYKKAEEALDFALVHCPSKCPRNKQLVLQYLVPLKMLLGKLPTELLLTKYNLDEYKSLAKAVREGNLKLFEEEVHRYQHLFVQRGVYLIVEKLKIITYRNFFKRICHITGSNKVPLTSCEAGLRLMGMHDADVDEIECILANLIFEGYIKGYIAHKAKYLVLSKVSAFPPIAQVIG